MLCGVASDVTVYTASLGRAWTGVAGGEAMAGVGSLERTKLFKSAWVVFEEYCLKSRRINIAQIAKCETVDVPSGRLWPV